MNLLPTKKLIEEVKKSFPNLKMVTFKYEENISHEELISIAQNRLSNNDSTRIATRIKFRLLSDERWKNIIFI